MTSQNVSRLRYRVFCHSVVSSGISSHLPFTLAQTPGGELCEETNLEWCTVLEAGFRGWGSSGALGRMGQAGEHRCYATGRDQAPGPRWLMASGWNLVGGLTLRGDRRKEGERLPSSHSAASQMRALLAR